MRNIFLTILLSWLLSPVVSAQSMYGDEVKADVKMNYVYTFEEALVQAKEQNKLIFFNCFADWAIPCHSMNKQVFSDQAFADWMDKNFVNFFTDVTQGNGRSLAKKYDIKTQPHYLVLDANGEVVHRIVGGSAIPNFKKQLMRALSPKTSLRGLTAEYEKGNRKLKFLRDYYDVLWQAEESERATRVHEEAFVQIKKKDWTRSENWNFFRAALNKDYESYFEDILNSKTLFVKSNGEEAVNKAIISVFERKLYPFLVGNSEYDALKLTDIFIEIQKADLPKDDRTYALYAFSKSRGEGDLPAMIQILKQNSDVWPGNMLQIIDLSLNKLNDLSPEDKALLTAYWNDRAEVLGKSSSANHYRNAVKSLNTPDVGGIQFVSISFDDALKLAAKENKLIFMDCFTTWCGPCKWLDANTFKDEKLAAYFNQNFVNLKVDMEKGEGIALREKMNVTAFPTMFLLDAQGNVITRIVGALDAKALMDKVTGI